MSAVAVPLPARRPGVRAVYRWDLRKLLAQKHRPTVRAPAVDEL
jgi:hypothetical protein